VYGPPAIEEVKLPAVNLTNELESVIVIANAVFVPSGAIPALAVIWHLSLDQ
jgi:hypothetical protein